MTATSEQILGLEHEREQPPRLLVVRVYAPLGDEAVARNGLRDHRAIERGHGAHRAAVNEDLVRTLVGSRERQAEQATWPRRAGSLLR